MAALLPASLATFSWKPPATGSESATQAHCLSEQEGELLGASGLRGKGSPLPETASPGTSTVVPRGLSRTPLGSPCSPSR